MSKLESFGITAGRVITVDEEIELIERLVETHRVEHMLNLVLERAGPGTYKAHICTLGTPLPRVREMLKIALGAVDDMIGKERG
jgi:hypothetical protein